MPYTLAPKTFKQLQDNTFPQDIYDALTPLQKKALDYAFMVADEEGENFTFGAADVARNTGYPNGQYFRGVLASLHKKGLLTKHEE